MVFPTDSRPIQGELPQTHCIQQHRERQQTRSIRRGHSLSKDYG